MNIIALQHGSQNAFFKTMSAVLNLPHWSETGIKTAKLAAAKIIRSVADQSVATAQQQLYQCTSNHPKQYLKLLTSADGACSNKANNNAEYCYMQQVVQILNLCMNIVLQRNGSSKFKKIRVSVSY